MKRSPALLLVALAPAALLPACSRSDASPTAAASFVATAAVDTAASAREVALVANDTMKFNTTQIYAKPGESLAVTLTNQGTIPKLAMGHNFVLLKPDTDLLAFAQQGASAAANAYIPESFQDKVLASTKLLGPKESDTVRFRAPTTPGHYPFVCTFPGHMQVGMKGELIVE